MTTIYQLPTPIPAMVDVLPAFKFMVSGDDLEAITTAGYLNSIDLQSNPISSGDVLQILYNYNLYTKKGNYGNFSVSIEDGIITLSPATEAGTVSYIPPVVDGQFAMWHGTEGVLDTKGFSATSNALNKVVMLQPINSGATPLASHIPVFLDSNGSICQQQENTPSFLPGPLYIKGASLNNAFGISLSSGTPTDFSSNIQGLNNLTQNTNYHMIDPANAQATLATFVGYPVEIIKGNLLVAGLIPGTIEDGGVPASGFVKTSGSSNMEPNSFIKFDTETDVISGSNVTINKQSGRIETNDLTTPSGDVYSFTLTNSFITTNSVILLQLQYGTNTKHNIECVLLEIPSTGSCVISLINNNSTAMDGNMIIDFFVAC